MLQSTAARVVVLDVAHRGTERTPGALPVEDLLPQDVCMPAVPGEFAQYVRVHPAQRERATLLRDAGGKTCCPVPGGVSAWQPASLPSPPATGGGSLSRKEGRR